MVLLLDTSASMATADVAPSRFFLARQALLQLMSRLEGDRFALVAFEGEAYPLVPLTLDADALGLFLETVEPGIVPAPGTSLGVGLAKGLDAFVDKERRNKVMVLVSDGEDLEGEVEQAVRRAKDAGVVVHTVAVGTEAGQPVPETDANGRVTGYKRDAEGNPVVSRLDAQALESIAAGTGGQAFRITPQDTSLSRLASADRGHGAEGARARVLVSAQGAVPVAARRRSGLPRAGAAASAAAAAAPRRRPLPLAPPAAAARCAPLPAGAQTHAWRESRRSCAAGRRGPGAAPQRAAAAPRLGARRDPAARQARHGRGSCAVRQGQPPRRRSPRSSARRRRGRRTPRCASTSPTACTRTAATTRPPRCTARSGPTRARGSPRRRASTSATACTRSRTTRAP